MSRFQPGDRVTLSAEARRRGIHPRNQARQGTVRSVSSIRDVVTVYVRWDGRVSDEGMHEVYLYLVERPR